jgi:hypothetical protein
MNANARKWVTALRSGAYKQARESLRVGDGFCCLGVACDLYAQEHDKKWDSPPHIVWDGPFLFMGKTAELPTNVVVWLGLENCMGRQENGMTLSEANDTGRSFSEIADIIESEPDGLFSRIDSSAD